MSASRMEKQNEDLKHVEKPVEETVEIQKLDVAETTYQGDGGEKQKSPAERRLLLKSDLVILPLAALVYLTAYLVSAPSSCPKN